MTESLKETCLRYLLVHEDTPGNVGVVPTEVRRELVRKKLLLGLLCGADARLREGSRPICRVLPLLSREEGAREIYEKLTEMMPLLRLFLGMQVSLMDVQVVAETRHLAGRPWEGEEAEMLLCLSDGSRLAVDCERPGMQAGGHFAVPAPAAMLGPSFLQAVRAHWAEEEDGNVALTLVVTDYPLRGAQVGRGAALMQSSVLMQEEGDGEGTNTRALLAAGLRGVLEDLTGGTCTACCVAGIPEEALAALPCPTHLAQLQTVSGFDPERWLEALAVALPHEGCFAERLFEARQDTKAMLEKMKGNI